MGQEAVIAARARCAKQIQDSPNLFAKYEAVGGLADDLKRIIDAGERYAALALAQSQSQASGSEATMQILEKYSDLQRDYSGVMAAVEAVKHDLERASADSELIAQVEKILINETPTVLVPVTGQDGKSKKVRSKSQEAVRSEIEKDAAALLALDGAKDALEARKVTRTRLEKLLADAKALAGKLADRAAKKGAKVSATQARKDVDATQRQAWGACYRLLALVGQQDESIASLLREASRK
ncbi:MAG: hypothetical protein QM765_47230 [Myxococcales bacterium]